MYIRMTKGEVDTPYRITAEQALSAIAREPVSGTPRVLTSIIPPFEARRDHVLSVRAAWATVPVPPGAETIGDDPARSESGTS